LLNILDTDPSCQGILFDQPQVVAEAPQHDRMECVGGDFFAEIPISADAYLLRWIIHDWADDKAIAILENVREAAKPGARLLLVESVIPETPGFDMGKWMDVNLLVMAGGCERTATEFRDLYDQAGFELEQIIPTPSPLSIVVGKPRA
jgi:O-methyltransferase domain